MRLRYMRLRSALNPVAVFLIITFLALTAFGAAHERYMSSKAKDHLEDTLHESVDKNFPNGDNAPGHAVVDSAFRDKGHPIRAFLRVFFTGSTTARPDQDAGLQRQLISNPKVVPASPANENAVPVHEGHAASPAEISKDSVEKSVVPSMPKDVGVTTVAPTVNDHDHNVGPSGGAHDHDHTKDWAGPDKGATGKV